MQVETMIFLETAPIWHTSRLVYYQYVFSVRSLPAWNGTSCPKTFHVILYRFVWKWSLNLRHFF